MRVGGATRTTLRSVLESWDLGDRSDSVLDAAIRELRQTLGSARPDMVEGELEVFTPAFLSLGRLGVELSARRVGPVFVGVVGSCQWRSSDQVQIGTSV